MFLQDENSHTFTKQFKLAEIFKGSYVHTIKNINQTSTWLLHNHNKVDPH